MTPVAGTSEDSETAAQFRDAMADKLLKDGNITSAVVERAVRAVPRHEFAPADIPLDVVYNARKVVVTKQDEHGVAMSSISAPWVQALMIEQAGLAPGMSVLEIGSGGYNAALLAEVVGASGRVVSVDIDPDVTGRAETCLAATGYGDRVTVVLADAENGIPATGPFDAVIVTVGAWDIPPAWLELLAEDGRLVLPLRMNGITRVIAFRRDHDHLLSESAEVAGFVPMQGAGGHPEHVCGLPDPHGHTVKLRFDVHGPEDPSLLDGVLATERTVVWSGVTTPHMVSFADMHLWFACYLPGFCQLTADDGTDLANERDSWYPYGAVRGDSFAYLTVRDTVEGDGAEFGACAYGPHGKDAAAAMVEQIQAWDRQARHAEPPTFGYWPAGSDVGYLPEGTAVLPKTHGLVTISWPNSPTR